MNMLWLSAAGESSCAIIDGVMIPTCEPQITEYLRRREAECHPMPRVGRVDFMGWDAWERFVRLWAIVGKREAIFASR